MVTAEGSQQALSNPSGILPPIGNGTSDLTSLPEHGLHHVRPSNTTSGVYQPGVDGLEVSDHNNNNKDTNPNISEVSNQISTPNCDVIDEQVITAPLSIRDSTPSDNTASTNLSRVREYVSRPNQKSRELQHYQERLNSVNTSSARTTDEVDTQVEYGYTANNHPDKGKEIVVVSTNSDYPSSTAPNLRIGGAEKIEEEGDNKSSLFVSPGIGKKITKERRQT